MFKKVDGKVSREKRHLRVHRKISDTPERPRLSAYRNEKNIYVRVVDDANSVILVSASSLGKVFGAKASGNKEAVRMVGGLVARRAPEKGVSEIIFDRGGYVYHEGVQTLAGATREAGLKL